MKRSVNLTRWDEAMNLLETFKHDLVLCQLLNNANYLVLCRVNATNQEVLPAKDIDLYFLLKAVKRTCWERSFLKTVLSEGDLWVFDKEIRRISISQTLAAEYLAFGGNQGFYTELDSIFGRPIDEYLRKAIANYNRDPQGEEPVGLINIAKAMEFLIPEKEKATSTLMYYAHYFVWQGIVYGKNRPSTSFDLYFFMQVMRDFFSNRDFLMRVLEGEDLRWFSDLDSDNDHLQR